MEKVIKAGAAPAPTMATPAAPSAVNPAAAAAQAAHHTRCIRITPDNATEARDLVKRWPQLDSLVRSLQAADMFPGLRALQITLTGPADYVAGGLGAVMPQNAPSGDFDFSGTT